jgi:hypothetical protein
MKIEFKPIYKNLCYPEFAAPNINNQGGVIGDSISNQPIFDLAWAKSSGLSAVSCFAAFYTHLPLLRPFIASVNTPIDTPIDNPINSPIDIPNNTPCQRQGGWHNRSSRNDASRSGTFGEA